MLECLQQDYVRVARAKGLVERAVVLRHALRNALVPVVTLGGLAYANLLTGAVMTETIFAWPGLAAISRTRFLPPTCRPCWAVRWSWAWLS